MDVKRKSNFIKEIIRNATLSRDNENYLHIKKVLEEIESKSLRIDSIKYLLSNRKNDYNNFIYCKELLKEDIDTCKSLYIIDTFLNDSEFLFENIFFINIHKDLENNNLSLDEETMKCSDLLFKKKITGQDYYKELKKISLKYFNIKVLNFFESSNILVELDLNRPLEELQESLKLAKKSFDKESRKMDYKFGIKSNNILDDELFEKMKNKRNVNIPLNEKLIDILFVIDCLLLEYKPKKIKDSLENYYLNFNSKIGDIRGKYYDRLATEAKQIINKIKKNNISPTK